MVGLLARRLTGKYIAPESEHLKKRVEEIHEGRYDDLIEQIMQKPIEEMKELYNTREIENKEGVFMFTPEMMESVKKVEATRDKRMGMEPRRMTADEKDALLKAFHPDYKDAAFETIKIGPNKGQKAPAELVHLLHSNSRLTKEKIDLQKIDYDVDVLVIGGGGAGASAAIEAHEAGADVMIVTKLRIGDANTMMAEGGIQAADKENDSPAQHYLDAYGGGHFAARPELLRRLVMEAPDAIQWLNQLGVMFDKDETGRMSRLTEAERPESGCMHARIIPARRLCAPFATR